MSSTPFNYSRQTRRPILAPVVIRQFASSIGVIVLAFAAGFSVSYFDTLALLPLLILCWRFARSRVEYCFAYQLFIFAVFPDLGGGIANQYDIVDPLARFTCHAGTAAWALLLSAPGLSLWTWRNHQNLFRRLVATATAWLIIPLVISPVMVLHPAMAAGAWFPGSGIFGMIIMGLVVVLAGSLNEVTLISAVSVVTAIVAQAAHQTYSPPVPDTSLAAVQLSVGKPAQAIAMRARQLETLRDNVQSAMTAGATTIITPELVVHQRDNSMAAWQSMTDSILKRQAVTVWSGAEVWSNGQVVNLMGSSKQEDAPVAALVPLPFVMWKPWSGLPEGFTDSGTRWRATTSAGAVGILFCFESITPSAWIERTLTKPKTRNITVVFTSSQWWAPSERVGRVLSIAARSFAQLNSADYKAAIAK